MLIVDEVQAPALVEQRQNWGWSPCINGPPPSSNTAIASFARDAEPGAGINPKTVAKWRKRATVEDLKTGPKAPHSTTLTEAEEAMVVVFRRHTLLPLDDCLYAL